MQKTIFTPENISDGLIVKYWQGNNYYPVERINITPEGYIISRQKYNGRYFFMPWPGVYTVADLLYRLNTASTYIVASNENANTFD